MDEFMGIAFALIALVVGVINAASKKKDENAKEAYKQLVQNTAAPSSPAKPSMATMLPPRENSPAPAVPSAPPVHVEMAPAQVSVHTHVDPACAVHDAPSGSLNAASPEGKDPCHQAQMAPRPSFAEVQEEDAGLTLDLSGDGLVKAFIMQEVLTRPSQRRMAR